MSEAAAPGFAPGPAERADLSALAELAESAMPGGPGPAELEGALERPSGRLHVARRSGTLAAFVLATRAADLLEIAWIAVDARHRRMGVGTRLLDDLVSSEAAAGGLSAVQLEVRASNQAAQGFYAASGFVAVGRRERYYRGGEDAILMTRTS